MRVMSLHRRFACVLGLVAALLAPLEGSERFTATAAVKNASGAAAPVPLTIVVDKFSTDAERESLLKVLKDGGTAGRELLARRRPVGSLQIGTRTTPIKYAYAASAEDRRQITIVTGSPIALDGAGGASAAATPGFDFGLVLLDVPSSGTGTGDLVPATKIRVEADNTIVTEDASPNLVKLSNVTVSK
jgi:hypothetical protein